METVTIPAALQRRIDELRRERNAIILAHNYQRPDVQDIADIVGDSLELSRAAAATDAAVIVFCGVHFMAETAALLCPDKTVLLPHMEAGCPMADMATAEGVRAWREKNPGGVVVTYINSSAAVKAESDVCCTSANATDIVRRINPAAKILFTPDRNLGAFVSCRLNRPMECWNGYCPTHQRLLPEMVASARAEHPGAVVIVHPESRPAVVLEADEALGTAGMLRFCANAPQREFIIGTETGMLHRLAKENPEKRFYPLSPLAVCPNMKKTTLDCIIQCLETGEGAIRVPEAYAARARMPIDRMLA